MEYKPHPYQVHCEQRIINDPAVALFLSMGLGKSVITLSAIRRLKYDMFQIRRALVIAPLKVAEATWTNEAAKWDHLHGLRLSRVLGTEAQRIAALDAQADVYVINRDNVIWLVERLRHNWPFDMVVIDELTSFKNPGAKRFKALRAMLPSIKRVVGLTGTPAPNGIEDLWSQIYLLDQGKRLGRLLTRYREAYFSFNPYSHEYKPLAGAAEKVHALISDICISLSAEDYLQMPELIVDDIPVQLDEQARNRYKAMERTMLLEVGDDVVTAGSAAVLTNKLLQMCSGAVYGEDGQTLQLHTCKLDALAELVEGLNGEKALLFYGYQHEIPRIEAAIRKTNPNLRLRKYEKSQDADAWNRGEIDILLAHPASCAYGLNLQQGGHHIIWYTLNWSLELYLQANARLHRQGQEHPVIIHRLIVEGGMDEAAAEALAKKDGIQEAMLTALKARIDEVRRDV